MLNSDFLSCCLVIEIMDEKYVRKQVMYGIKRNPWRIWNPASEDLSCVWGIWVIERVHHQWRNLVDGSDMILHILSTSANVGPKWRFESWSELFGKIYYLLSHIHTQCNVKLPFSVLSGPLPTPQKINIFLPFPKDDIDKDTDGVGVKDKMTTISMLMKTMTMIMK